MNQNVILQVKYAAVIVFTTTTASANINNGKYFSKKHTNRSTKTNNVWQSMRI